MVSVDSAGGRRRTRRMVGTTTGVSVQGSAKKRATPKRLVNIVTSGVGEEWFVSCSRIQTWPLWISAWLASIALVAGGGREERLALHREFLGRVVLKRGLHQNGWLLVTSGGGGESEWFVSFSRKQTWPLELNLSMVSIDSAGGRRRTRRMVGSTPGVSVQGSARKRATPKRLVTSY